MGAIFIPISAVNAFIYRKTAHLTPETLYNFDKDLLDKIGRDEVGRQWKSMTMEQKVKTIQNAISDTKAYEERLSDTNFDKFLSVLSYFIGGEEAQKARISSQIETLFTMLALDDSLSLGKVMQDAQRMRQAIGESAAGLEDRFWSAYRIRQCNALQKVESEVDPSYLQIPFQDLVDYHKVAAAMNWDAETARVVNAMKGLLKQQLAYVAEFEASWSLRQFLSEMNQVEKVACPVDWETILFSILLPSSEIEFNASFGRYRQRLEKALQVYRTRYNPEITLQDVNEGLPFPEARYLEAVHNMNDNPKSKDAIVKITMPEELSDSSHWGYLGWKYVTFCRSIKK
ncbi:MAG: hypothetical protein SGARI_005118 [Bacillariaceae sp.]